MAGIVNDYLIYPVLDLIRAGVKEAVTNIADDRDGIEFFSGIPSIELIRDHPDDSSKTFLTQVIQTYDNGYVMNVRLIYGEGAISPYHKWRLSSVITSLTDEGGELLLQHETTLHYGERNEVEYTEVTHLYSLDEEEEGDETYGEADY